MQDLQLDNPEAGHLLALFLGRAIVDEALAPSFLAAVLPSLEDHSEGVSVVQSTGPPRRFPRCLAVCLSVYLPVCLSVCLFVGLPVCLFVFVWFSVLMTLGAVIVSSRV